MEILINELSLTGQFKNEDEFLDNFDSILKIINFIDILNFSLSKEFKFFDMPVTSKYKLNDFLKLRIDKARRMKRFLAKLAQNPPFWNETQKHSCSRDNYTYNGNDICNTSLAESCERDKVVLSFSHVSFRDTSINIKKNNTDTSIYNLIEKDDFLEYLLSTTQIEPLDYCKLKFKNSNLNFSYLDDKYGFNILNRTQIKEFLDCFVKFSLLEWSSINRDGGFQHKPYQGDWFKKTKYAKKDIYKFRVTQKYRCFGYREKNEFFILRFEVEHKISDNG